MEYGGTWRNFSGDETCYILIVVVGTGVYVFVKIQWTEHLKWDYFIMCKLYLKKVDFENAFCSISLVGSLTSLDDLRSWFKFPYLLTVGSWLSYSIYKIGIMTTFGQAFAVALRNRRGDECVKVSFEPWYSAENWLSLPLCSSLCKSEWNYLEMVPHLKFQTVDPLTWAPNELSAYWMPGQSTENPSKFS